jgi:hypothetical protein
MMLGDGFTVKGCAPRTGVPPALALDRETVAKLIAMMPLWRIVRRTLLFG